MPCNIRKKFFAELLGTFFLVFFGTGSAVVTLLVSQSINPANVGIGVLGGLGDWIAIALAFGLTVMIGIYAFGRISGAHFNPAVTIGLLVTKNIPLVDSIYYIVAQLIGACLGSLALFLCLGAQAVTIGGLGATAPGLGIGYMQAMFAEFIGTFFLMMVIMGVAVDKKAEPGFAGVSIGMTVTAVIVVLGSFTGASINPARTFGPYLMDMILGGQNLWGFFPIYLVGPILGAICAAFAYAYLAKNSGVCELPQPFKDE
ncbi:glycerol uptake facilitator protein [Methanobrevibacter gottschalkii]|uniref:Glycerol uptake facilitator protein n=2 Tax=Methanobrevibacter gottschalkii TaxID=190974 RepID=A0A3N5B8H5_9EURY|nr:MULTISPECIES: MIP/aquaporin family protein [Methanobrevibacter]MCQ2969989.1 aquaporin family protein [archaeon]OEC98049.1 aquaporin [Methanobrevibacter sp. A27]RPF51790.1 glycerol uptake facilitator protein [Methanobrevibacter gottschalkii DSM 11977]SEK96399.1 glycerol uptake facilitator protein [Methanobrevibacter gottschalkii]